MIVTYLKTVHTICKNINLYLINYYFNQLFLSTYVLLAFLLIDRHQRNLVLLFSLHHKLGSNILFFLMRF